MLTTRTDKQLGCALCGPYPCLRLLDSSRQPLLPLLLLLSPLLRLIQQLPFQRLQLLLQESRRCRLLPATAADVSTLLLLLLQLLVQGGHLLLYGSKLLLQGCALSPPGRHSAGRCA